MKKMTVYRCDICGNLICMIENSGVVPMCCNQMMRLVEENTQDSVREKHLPVIFRNEDFVRAAVGEKPHPMTDDHYIKWILLFTDREVYGRNLLPGEDPVAVFRINRDEKVLCAYAFCNIHGLWRNDD